MDTRKMLGLLVIFFMWIFVLVAVMFLRCFLFLEFVLLLEKRGCMVASHMTSTVDGISSMRLIARGAWMS